MDEHNADHLHDTGRRDICMGGAEEDPHPPHDDSDTTRQQELSQFKELVASTEWWNWPEAVAWIGTRDLMKIAKLRHWDAVSLKSGDYDGNIMLGAQQLMVSNWCGSWSSMENELHLAIERGAVRTIGRNAQHGPAAELTKEIWRGGMIVYSCAAAVLVSAKNKLNTWAFDIAVHRGDLLTAFPSLQQRSTDPAESIQQGNPVKAKPIRKRPGPAPDPDWPHAIAKVTQDCIAAGYKLPRKRGDKAAIQTMLLNYMADRNKHFSDDIAAKHAETVIGALPDN